MARKANVTQEEIHAACWELIGQNLYPNIPRMAEYFLQKDGRKCSNTTFMKAISEWEESYRERQDNQLESLAEVLEPTFKSFGRKLTQQLGQLLDEKTLELEVHQEVKHGAIEGGYLSLSQALSSLQEELDSLSMDYQEKQKLANELEQKLQYSEQRQSDLVAQNQVLLHQLEQEKIHNKILQANLSQKEVDLAKLDNELSAAKLLSAEEVKKKDIELFKYKEEADLRWQRVNDRLDAMSASLLSFQNKDREIRE